MKKRMIALASVAALTAGLFAGCGNSQSGSSSSSAKTETKSESKTETKSEAAETKSETASADAARGEGKKVTALFFSLEGEFFNVFDSMLKEGLEALGYEYESQSSNNSSVTMIEQIENANAKGSDLIWVWPTNGEEVADACRKAMDNGSLIYAFVEDPGEDSRNVFRGSDSAQNGIDMATMAMQWADKEYGEDAEDGSIRTLIITNNDIPANKTRGEYIISTIAEDPRFDVVEVKDCEQSVVAAQTLCENLFAKYGDTIDCILALVPALGVCAYLDSESCVVEDPARIGVISTEVNEELADYMRRGLYDATLVNGGNPADNAAKQVIEMDALMHGEMENGFSAVDSGLVTVDNLEQFGY